MEHKLLRKLPEELKRLIGSSHATQNHIGCTNSEVWCLKGMPSIKGVAYLKIMPYHELENLEFEVAVLEWLQGKVSVPEVYYYTKHHNLEFLLMSEVAGFDCSTEIYRCDPETMVKNFAVGMRQLHGLDISNCPFDQTLQYKLKKAQFNVEHGFVDEENFEAENFGKTARELYEQLLAQKPLGEDLVFTHGDYCLPNIIIKGDAVGGFIDLGRAGIADRYQDLALATRSLRHNMDSEKWVRLFFNHYGLSDVDSSKIDFYVLLDEFF